MQLISTFSHEFTPDRQRSSTAMIVLVTAVEIGAKSWAERGEMGVGCKNNSEYSVVSLCVNTFTSSVKLFEKKSERVA